MWLTRLHSVQPLPNYLGLLFNLLAIVVRFRLSDAASGTVCRLTSSQLPLTVFFETVSKLISFPDHFLRNGFRLLVLHTVYSNGLAVFVLYATLNNSM